MPQEKDFRKKKNPNYKRLKPIVKRIINKFKDDDFPINIFYDEESHKFRFGKATLDSDDIDEIIENGAIPSRKKIFYGFYNEYIEPELMEFSLKELKVMSRDFFHLFFVAISNVFYIDSKGQRDLKELGIGTKLELARDLSDSNNVRVFSLKEDKLLIGLDGHAFLKKLNFKTRNYLSENLPLCKMEYNYIDLAPRKKVSKNGVDYICYNAYTPPAWLLDSSNRYGDSRSLPKLFREFFCFLIPDKKERYLVLEWLCVACFGRCETFLNLRGIRGNAKTLFMKIVMQVAGGGHLALEGVIQGSGFNADLRYKRIVGVDDDEEIGTKHGNKLRKKIN